MNQPTSAPSTSPKAPSSAAILVIGLVLAGLAVVLMNVYVKVRLDQQKLETVTVWRFTTERRSNQNINNTHLQAFQFPKQYIDSLPNGTVRSEKDGGTGVSLYYNAKLTKNVAAKQLLTSDVFDKTYSDTESNPIQFGRVAVPITVDSNSLSPLLKPGVDINLLAPIYNNTSRRYNTRADVMVVVQGLKVLASGGDAIGTDTDSRSGASTTTLTLSCPAKLGVELARIQKAMTLRGSPAFLYQVRADSDTNSSLIDVGLERINPDIYEKLGLDVPKTQ